MNKRRYLILSGGLIFLLALLLPISNYWLELTLFLISYIIVGGDVVVSAIRHIIKGNVFDENLLMSIATIGAFAIGDFPEGVAVMLFYQVGELFQSYAVSQSRKSIGELMDIRPDYANVKRGEETVRLDPYDVQIGEQLIIKAGERIPLDCRVIKGNSMLDTTALTGESVPREVGVGDELMSGCINVNGLIIAEVTKEYGDSTVTKILDLVENASSKKSKSEQFITRFARYYTPTVVIVAVLLAFIPPIIIEGASFQDWIYRALNFLVVSCPCALVISIPLSFFGGIGGASRKGILVKGSNYMEALAQTEIIVFDKTGTLTKGVFEVEKLYPVGRSEEELLEYAAYAESYSNHPISQSLKRAFGKEIDNSRISNVNELAGHGVIAEVDGITILAGNQKLMEQRNIAYQPQDVAGTIVYVAIDNHFAGSIIIADQLKEDSQRTIYELKAMYHKRTVMLTGDTKKIGEQIANQIGIESVYTELLPGDKVQIIEELLEQKSAKGRLAYVGDGINDAPVLTRADVGIAMGGLGSDAAIEAADIVIMTDEPSKIITAIRICKKTMNIARQNSFFAIGVKISVLILSALGMANMWAAVFADVGVTVLAIINSFRALRVNNMESSLEVN